MSSKFNNYVWKTKKNYVDGKPVQSEVRLIDCDRTELQSYYNHCHQMLYNENPSRPGRYPLLNTIKVQRERCGAELYVRYLREQNQDTTQYLMSLHSTLRNTIRENTNSDGVCSTTEQELKNLTINVINNCPSEFHDVTINEVIEACLGKLGVFDKTPITLTFILRQGIWYTSQEMTELTEHDENGVLRERREVIKERLRLPSTTRILINPEGLTYSEFRSMINLGKNKKYSELSSTQLLTLRNKILIELENSVRYHISDWEKLQKQIVDVADYLGYELDLI